VWDAWAAGDRKGALAAVPDDLVDALVLHGTPADVRAKLNEYVANGVQTPVIALVPAPGTEPLAAVHALSPVGGDSWN
jgi:alkanesulfonate monooxygenase SsuD/methylene tetrahydromethanopterin reductase-like flavin-dependent oxidoreductase (luciferase family)